MTLSGTAGNGQAVFMNVVTTIMDYYAFNNVLRGNYQRYLSKYHKDMYSQLQMPEMTMLILTFASSTLSGITLTSGQNINTRCRIIKK